MLIDGIHKKAIESSSDFKVSIIDQTLLPHKLKYITLKNIDDCVKAIRDMWVRGAPLIGVTASYGMFFAVKDNPSELNIRKARFMQGVKQNEKQDTRKDAESKAKIVEIASKVAREEKKRD